MHISVALSVNTAVTSLTNHAVAGTADSIQLWTYVAVLDLKSSSVTVAFVSPVPSVPSALLQNVASRGVGSRHVRYAATDALRDGNVPY